MLLAIDPGTESSGLVFVDENKTITPHVTDNELIFDMINTDMVQQVAIEGFWPRNKKIGVTTFKAMNWASRFYQCAIDHGKKSAFIYTKKSNKDVGAKSVSVFLTGENNSKVGERKKAIKRMYPELAPFERFNCTGDHMWSALAVALTWMGSKRFLMEVRK